MVGFAVNITGSPTQIIEPVDVMETDAGKIGVTVIVIVFETTEDGVGQIAFEVITTETTSPLTKVEDVNVTEVAPPTFIPFISH